MPVRMGSHRKCGENHAGNLRPICLEVPVESAGDELRRRPPCWFSGASGPDVDTSRLFPWPALRPAQREVALATTPVDPVRPPPSYAPLPAPGLEALQRRRDGSNDAPQRRTPHPDGCSSGSANDIQFSGERKRARCNQGLEAPWHSSDVILRPRRESCGGRSGGVALQSPAALRTRRTVPDFSRLTQGVQRVVDGQEDRRFERAKCTPGADGKYNRCHGHVVRRLP